MIKISITDKDSGWERIKREVAKMRGSHVNVGVLSNAPAYDAGNNANMADVATWNEFGTEKIPARPFMAQTFDRNIQKISRNVESETSKILKGTSTVNSSLEKIGHWYVGETKKTFTSGDFVPNKPSTIAKKGSSRPLIDTGRLRASINHEVKIK